MVESCKQATLCILRAIASVDANPRKAWNIHEKRERFLKALGKVHDAVVSACWDCRLSGNFRAAADRRFHGVTDEMALRVVFVGTPCLEVGVKVFVGNLHDSDGAVIKEDLALYIDVDSFEFHDC